MKTINLYISSLLSCGISIENGPKVFGVIIFVFPFQFSTSASIITCNVSLLRDILFNRSSNKFWNVVFGEYRDAPLLAISSYLISAILTGFLSNTIIGASLFVLFSQQLILSLTKAFAAMVFKVGANLLGLGNTAGRLINCSIFSAARCTIMILVW